MIKLLCLDRVLPNFLPSENLWNPFPSIGIINGVGEVVNTLGGQYQIMRTEKGFTL
jgi:hypothetical protein